MAHPDLDELLGALIPLAQQMVAKLGSFFPFGAQMSSSGQIASTAGYTGNERPSSQEIIDLLIGGYRDHAARGEVRAVGICLDVRIVPPGQSKKCDAICVRLEHQNGECVEVFLTYRKTWLRKISYGEIFSAPGQKTVFGPPLAE